MSSLKSEMLTLFEQNRGTLISGGMMADKFGVSRSAVWKAVEALRRNGYIIESAANSGYVFSNDNDILSEEGICAFLGEKRRGMRIICLDETDSTNSEAKRTAAAENGPLLIAANSQTAGRGRMGRSFYSPKNTGLYMTLALDTGERTEDAVKLTCAASVAVVRAIESITGLKPSIKWVNDIYFGGSKVCGILTEGVFDLNTGRMGRVLIGIGINVSTQSFPEELDSAVSLNVPSLVRNRLAARAADELMDIVEGEKEWIECYRAHSAVLGRTITYFEHGMGIRAKAVGIEDDGGLAVINADGTKAVLKSGEISVRLS